MPVQQPVAFLTWFECLIWGRIGRAVSINASNKNNRYVAVRQPCGSLRSVLIHRLKHAYEKGWGKVPIASFVV